MEEPLKKKFYPQKSGQGLMAQPWARVAKFWGEHTLSPSLRVVPQKKFTLKNFNSLPDHQEDWQHLLESDLNSLGQMGEGLMVPLWLADWPDFLGRAWYPQPWSQERMVASGNQFPRGVGGAKNSEHHPVVGHVLGPSQSLNHSVPLCDVMASQSLREIFFKWSTSRKTGQGTFRWLHPGVPNMSGTGLNCRKCDQR